MSDNKKTCIIICPDLTGGGEEYRTQIFGSYLVERSVFVYRITRLGVFLQDGTGLQKVPSFHLLKLRPKNTVVFGFKRWSLLYLSIFRVFTFRVHFSVANVYVNKTYLNFLIPTKGTISISRFVYKCDRYIELGNSRFMNRVIQQKDKMIGKVEILWIGKDNYHKGFDELIEQVKRLPNVTFNVIGSISLKGQRILKKYNNVELHGWVHDFSFFAEKNVIYLQTSNQEGFPNVLVECMHLGIPILATKVGASEDIIREYGKCFPNNISAENLRILINDVISNYQLMKTKAVQGIQYSKERFDEEKMLQSYYAIYKYG